MYLLDSWLSWPFGLDMTSFDIGKSQVTYEFVIYNDHRQNTGINLSMDMCGLSWLFSTFRKLPRKKLNFLGLTRMAASPSPYA